MNTKPKAAPAAGSNKGRITNPAQAWGVAYREKAEREGTTSQAQDTKAPAAESSDTGTANDTGTQDTGSESNALTTSTGTPSNPEVIHATQTLAVPLKLIAAALITAASKDIRYYLNSVFIHAAMVPDSEGKPVPGREIRIASTDGHRMLVSRYELPKDERMPEWAIAGLIIPREELAQVLPILTKNGTIAGQTLTGEEAIVYVEKAPGAEHFTVRTANHFGAFKMQAVEGKFPDYQPIFNSCGTVLARQEGSVMDTAAINANYMKGAAEVAGRLGSKSIHSFVGSAEQHVIFTFEGAPNSVLIVMPMRADKAVSEGVIKLLGAGSLGASIAALKAHATRTTAALKSALPKDRENLETKLQGFNARIAALQAQASAVPQLENKAAQ